MRTALPSEYCIYCGQRATSRDHVPPKLLLERPYPSNLQTVPSCIRCNQGASLDEQYFLVLIAQISLSPALLSKIAEGGIIDRALARSPALEERLLKSLEVDEEDGRVLIKPEMGRVQNVVRKIATGLFAIRYGKVPDPKRIGPIGVYPYQVRDDRPAAYFISTFTERFRSKQWKSAQSGVFSYIFVRDPKSSSKVWCVMDIHQTLWGVVHFPNPKSAKIRVDQQLWLFPPL